MDFNLTLKPFNGIFIYSNDTQFISELRTVMLFIQQTFKITTVIT